MKKLLAIVIVLLLTSAVSNTAINKKLQPDRVYHISNSVDSLNTAVGRLEFSINQLK